MNSSSFKRYELKKFFATIGFKQSDVEIIVTNLDNFYGEKIEKKVDKKTGEFKTYKDGTVKERIIRPSLYDLKKIQRKINERILAPIEMPTNVHGGIKKRSNITNAKPHQGNKYQFTTDLQEFYPSITSSRVYDTLIKLGFSTHYAHWITKLSTWKYELPQGAPTSTHIANLVFLETDIKLIEFCNENGITYTRYVDDLTFSSQKDFANILNDILQIVLQSGFKLSYRKTQYKGNQLITGIQVYHNKIDAPANVIEKAHLETDNHPSYKPYTNYLENIRKTNRRK